MNMIFNKHKTDFYIFIALLVLVLVILVWPLDQGTLDIQLHDTYYVLNRLYIIILLLGPLTFLIFLLRGLLARFRSISANIGLTIGLLLISHITYRIIQLDEWTGQDAQSKTSWIWIILGLWIICITLLVVKTVKILYEH